MKILVISHEYPPIGGGGANACQNLCREYSRMGHDITVVTAHYGDTPYRETSDNVKIIRVRALRKKTDTSSFVEMFSFLLSAYKYAGRLCRDERFDICHTFFGIPSGPIALHLKKRYKLPYVIRFGGGDIPGAQKRFALIYSLLSPFIRSIWKNADALVANSSGLKRRAEAFYDKKAISIIPNGVGSAADGDISADRQENRIVLLFVSRLIEGKGLQDILPQLPDLIVRYREKGIETEFRIVGDGPYRDELERLISQYGLEGSVKLCGKKGKDELPGYYGTADMFVFPSRSEGMPNVVLEAMSYGLPVVMTPCEGSEELIDGNGYVVRAEEFGSVISGLINDREKRQQLGSRSRELAVGKFNWTVAAESYLKLFGEICAEYADI